MPQEYECPALKNFFILVRPETVKSKTCDVVPAWCGHRIFAMRTRCASILCGRHETSNKWHKNSPTLCVVLQNREVRLLCISVNKQWRTIVQEVLGL